MRSLASALIIFALTSPIMLAGVLTALRRKRWPTRIVVTAGDFTRRLIPWAALERCEVTESPANRVKVHFKWTARIVGRIFTADDAVRLDAPFDRERLPALRTQVALWRARAQAGT